jgi:predicted HicB family RNase H-like nuclease
MSPDDPSNKLSIEVSAETRRALVKAAADHGLSVPDYVQEALRRFLAATGYLENRPARPG